MYDEKEYARKYRANMPKEQKEKYENTRRKCRKVEKKVRHILANLEKWSAKAKEMKEPEEEIRKILTFYDVTDEEMGMALAGTILLIKAMRGVDIYD